MASGHVGMMGSSLRQLNIVLFTLVLAASYCDSIHVEFVDTQEVQLKPMNHGALSEISNWFGNLHPQKQQSIDLSSEDISIGSLRKTKRSNYGKNMLNKEGEDLKHELKKNPKNIIKRNKQILKKKLKTEIRKNVTLSPTNPGVPTAHKHIRILTPDQTNIKRIGIVIKLKKPESNANKKYRKRTSNKKNKIRRKNKKNPSPNNKIKCTQKLKVKPKQIKIKDNSKSKRTFKENSKKMQNDIATTKKLPVTTEKLPVTTLKPTTTEQPKITTTQSTEKLPVTTLKPTNPTTTELPKITTTQSSTTEKLPDTTLQPTNPTTTEQPKITTTIPSTTQPTTRPTPKITIKPPTTPITAPTNGRTPGINSNDLSFISKGNCFWKSFTTAKPNVVTECHSFGCYVSEIRSDKGTGSRNRLIGMKSYQSNNKSSNDSQKPSITANNSKICRGFWCYTYNSASITSTNETSGQSGDATDGEVDEEIEATGQSGDGTDGEVDEELEPDGQSGDGTGCSNGGSGDYGGNTNGLGGIKGGSGGYGGSSNGFGGSNGNSNGYGNSNAAADQALAELGALIPGGGVPGVDYPVLAEVPDTDFECFAPGYYADTAPEAGCQVFHICQDGGLVDSFLCPNGTIFNQQYFVCDWWYNFDCATAKDFYELNGLIGQEPGQYDTLNDGASTGSYSAPGANDNGNGGYRNGNGNNYRMGNGNRNGSNRNGNVTTMEVMVME